MNSSNATNDGDIGGFAYIQSYLAIYLPYSIMSMIGVVVGITGIVHLDQYYTRKIN